MVVGSIFSQATVYRREALLGVWACGPYTLKGDGFEVTGTAASSYLDDGTYVSTSHLTVRMRGGKVVRTRDKVAGSWAFDGRIIQVHYKRVEFLWSDDPAYTVEIGQRNADAQLRKKSWSKAKVLKLDENLVTIPVESMHRRAEVAVTCARQ